MSNIITTGSIYSLLWPGLDRVGKAYKRYKGEYENIYTRRKSFKAQEVNLDMKMTGYALLKPEGEQIASDYMEQTYKYTFINRQYALGFAITDWAVKNNQYENEFNTKTRSLFNSYDQTKEVMAMNVFNQAFNKNVLIGDGQPLASAVHPYVGGTYANTFIAPDGTTGVVDFSETAIEQAIIQIQKFKDQAGLLIAARAKYLLLPPELEFSGCRLLKSMYRIGTANNDINAIYNLKAISNGYIVNHYLTSPSNYFLLTDVPETFLYYDHSPFETDMNVDPNTKTLKVNGVGAYSFGAFTPNGVFCGKGA